MKNLFVFFALSGLLVQASCSKVAASVFGPKTPREQYENKLKSDGLHETPEGSRWLAASELALSRPVDIAVPYRQQGRFPDSLQVALGLRFKAKRGEKLTFTIDKNHQQPFALYADLFSLDPSGIASLQHSADTSAAAFEYEIPTSGTYLLRLQPELLSGGNYSLVITAGPSIGFPVSDPQAYIGSLWGDRRDGGKRRHEGVDIFAKKGSPAVAAMDGIVTGVHEGGIGGKVVWLRPVGKDYTLYYAHLDQQLVQTGQMVQKGDQLGTVGNTGNARFTPAHLHFGVYTFEGPVDPLPFVNKRVRKPGSVPEKSLAGYLKLTQTPRSGSIKADSLLTPLAVTADGYLAAQPNGTVVRTPFTAVKLIKQEYLTGATAFKPGKHTSAISLQHYR